MLNDVYLCVFLSKYTIMKEKQDRHNTIRKILETIKVSSQEELKRELQELGFETTQATLSRDLAALRVIKVPDAEKGYIYALSKQYGSGQVTREDISPLSACKSIAFSHNLAVLKCLPSFAPSVALHIDGLELEGIVGTVAGDDTVLIVISEGLTHERFREILLDRLPELRERF